jgi:hypothetical protein
LKQEIAPAAVGRPGPRPTERGLTVDKASIEYGEERGQDHQHACWDGYVYLTYVGEEDGEEYEAFEAVPCRRCADEATR